MGYFQDLFDSVNKVNASGFDPTKETYSSRVGEFKITTDPTGGTATDPDPNTTTTDPTPNLAKSFTDLGYDDPFKDIVTDTGELDLSKVNTGIRLIKNDPDIGITPEDYTSFLNSEYRDAMVKTYGEGKKYEFRDGAIGFEKPPEPQEEAQPSYRFETSKQSFGSRKPIYYRFEEGTQDPRGGEKYITYDTEAEFLEAQEAYKKQ